MTQTRKKAATLKSVVEQFEPVVRALLKLEQDSAGITAQYNAIPHDAEGPEVLLDALYEKNEASVDAVIGSPLGDRSLRELLDAIRIVVNRTGVELDTRPLETKFSIWTDDDGLYESGGYERASRAGVPIQRQKYRLSHPKRLKLRADGSLVGYKRPNRVDSEEEGIGFFHVSH